jgi:hypothetical protein
VIQAKSGASMKKVQHNLKIAQSVAQRVQDLKQQVDSDQKQLQQVKNIDEIEPLLPFKKDTPTIHHDDVKNIPSVQDSSTGARHSSIILGNFLATKSQGMNLKHDKKHSKKYFEDIKKAKNQIKVAEQGMKLMDTEVKDFHNHMANSMSGLMKAFNDGFTALDKAKKEEEVKKDETAEKKEVEAKSEETTEAKKEDIIEAKKEESTETKEIEKKEEATESKETKENTTEV